MVGSEVRRMATSTTVPLSEYLRTTYRPDCEWIDGGVRERNMGELPHSSVQAFLTAFFMVRKREFGIRVYPELRLQVSVERYRVPDVMVMRASDPVDEIVRTPPMLCIEILSRDDSMSEMQERIDDYLAMGVEVVWVVDPRRRKAFIVDERGGQQPVEELIVPGTAIRVGVGEVFAELDELEGKL
jgi:Uma2 family endonuclease